MATQKEILNRIPQIAELSELDKIQFKDEIATLYTTISDIIHLEKKYEELFNVMDAKRKIENEVTSIMFPKIYFGKAKHHTSKEPYIIARCPYKKGVNDYVHFRVYVGAISKFPKGVDDPEVKKIALLKIRNKIKKLISKKL